MSDTSRKETIRKYYRIRAKDYDRQKSRTWKSDQGFGTEVFDEALSAFKGLKDKALLEVGVGNGRNAKPLLENVKPYFIGLDLTREMLNVARNKMLTCKQHFDLILGDTEHPPFKAETFDGVLRMSTMHYFENQEELLEDFAKLLKKNGIFVYGDLSPHNLDDQEFFEVLERTISKAHAKYYKVSEMKKLLEIHGFHVSRMKAIAYRKSYDTLIEDKGKYFGVGPEVLHRYLETANREAKEQYELTNTELTLFYTLITATIKLSCRD